MSGENPENHGKRPRSFLSFWGHAIKEGSKKSWEKFGSAIEISAFLLAVALLGVVWYSRHNRDFNAQNGEEFVNYWLAVIPLGIGLAWFVFHILKAPYEIYKEQFDKHQSEIENLRAEMESEIKARDLKISELEQKISEKSEADKLVLARQEAKNTFGIDLLALNKRLGEAREMSRYEFIDKVKDDAWTATNELFHKVQSDLALKLTLAEYSRFNITVGESVKEITDDPYFGQRMMDWLWHYNCILAKRDKLTEIIKELG